MRGEWKVERYAWPLSPYVILQKEKADIGRGGTSDIVIFVLFAIVELLTHTHLTYLGKRQVCHQMANSSIS